MIRIIQNTILSETISIFVELPFNPPRPILQCLVYATYLTVLGYRFQYSRGGQWWRVERLPPPSREEIHRHPPFKYKREKSSTDSLLGPNLILPILRKILVTLRVKEDWRLKDWSVHLLDLFVPFSNKTNRHICDSQVGWKSHKILNGWKPSPLGKKFSALSVFGLHIFSTFIDGGRGPRVRVKSHFWHLHQVYSFLGNEYGTLRLVDRKVLRRVYMFWRVGYSNELRSKVQNVINYSLYIVLPKGPSGVSSSSHNLKHRPVRRKEPVNRSGNYTGLDYHLSPTHGSEQRTRHLAGVTFWKRNR